MVRTLIGTIVGLLAVATVTAAQATTINFQSIPAGTVLTNQYSFLGVNFSALEDSAVVGAKIINRFGSGDFVWTNCTDLSSTTLCGPDISRADILRIEFDQPANNVSWITDSEGDKSITFNAYNIHDVLIESVSITGDDVLTLFSVGGILRIDMIQPFDDYGWFFDDMHFDIQPVPLPTTAWLFLAGLGMFGANAWIQKHGLKYIESNTDV